MRKSEEGNPKMNDFRGLVDTDYRGRFGCPANLCSFSADNQDQVVHHIETEHEGDVFTCPKCGGYVDATPWDPSFFKSVIDRHVESCEGKNE